MTSQNTPHILLAECPISFYYSFPRILSLVFSTIVLVEKETMGETTPSVEASFEKSEYCLYCRLYAVCYQQILNVA